MLKYTQVLYKKTVINFLLKTALFCFIFLMPLSFCQMFYGKFYVKVCSICFGSISQNGFGRFYLTKPITNVHIEIGNSSNTASNGTTTAATSDVNFRSRGYLPTIFLLSLILASPVSRKRKVFSASIGFLIISAFVFLKQWIHVLYIIEQSKWLSLFVFSPHEEMGIEFLYINFANFNGSTLVFVTAVWMAVTFTKDDLKKSIMPNRN